MNGRAMNGYMTVEATLIMPVVFYVCIFIIYMGFFKYDRCVMKQDAYRSALQGSRIYQDDTREVYNRAAAVMEELTEGKYIAIDPKHEITVQRAVQVQIAGRIEMPFSALRAMTGADSWQVEESAQSKCLNPVFFIRACRQLGIENNTTEKEEDL